MGLERLEADPYHVETYRALFQDFTRTDQHERAWCVARALVFLDKAERREKQLFEQHAPPALRRFRSLTPDIWRSVVHPGARHEITALLATTWRELVQTKSTRLRQHGLKRSDRRPLNSDRLMFTKLFVAAAALVDAPDPELYLVEGTGTPIELINASDKRLFGSEEMCPSIVVRPMLLQGKNETEVAFLCVQHLVMLRREYIASAMLSPSELLAALSRTTSSKPPTVEELVALRDAVQMSAHRIGLLWTEDLKAAADMIEWQNIKPLSRKTDLIGDLLRFGISDAYISARNRLLDTTRN